MSELKKCCRHCNHFQNGTCTLEPFDNESFDNSAILYKFINEGYLRKAITAALTDSDVSDKLFEHKTNKNKKHLIEDIADEIENNAETLANDISVNIRTDIFIADPDEFFCKYYF